MRPRLELLAPDLVERVLGEAFELLLQPGLKVQSAEAIQLLVDAGATSEGEIVRIPEAVVRRALETVPHSFELYDRAGRPAVHYGGDAVQFDPGSCGVAILDPETRESRPSLAADLVRLTQVAEQLPAYDAVSTAVICSDVPAELGDFYRLFLVLLHSSKPIVTGAFSARTTAVMVDLLAIDAGGRDALAERPRAIFDVCPSPPLTWSAFGAQNLIDLARARVPAEIISMPIAGVAAPVTLIGAVVQHAAETLAGIAIHQLANPGAPVVWGGAATIIDMRVGSTPMGAIESAMIDVACAQVGKSLDLPTHGYMGASDAKTVDAQAGFESGMTAQVGALAGINMISGAGMIDFLLCQSAEKLVLDAEAIGIAQRLVRGIGTPTETLATGSFAAAGPEGRFLELEETRKLFREEQFLPSKGVDRASRRAWLDAGGLDAFDRARVRVTELVASYRPPVMAPQVVAELIARVRHEGEAVSLVGLPGVLEELAASG
jgi:trimethylamine--corrinoid protein Co-methyltransferase